jgi:hypothetical protein
MYVRVVGSGTIRVVGVGTWRLKVLSDDEDVPPAVAVVDQASFGAIFG